MPSLTRSLAGEKLSFDLAAQIAELRADENYVRTGRVGRTLVKSGQLRLTLTLLAKDAKVATHHAEAPMTLQPLSGRLRYRVGDENFEIGAGELLFFGPGNAEDIQAIEDTALLLTLTGE